MIVESITLHDFVPFKDVTFNLSDGLTLITGDNGAGKSTLLEALAVALYNRTIRGVTRTGHVAVSCHIGGHVIDVTRLADGKRRELSLMVDGEEKNGATPTETQARIEQIFGSWERFASTRLFAREFMARFGAATDKERKALLEEILGLGQFDAAHTYAKAKAWEADMQVGRCEAVAAAQTSVATRAAAQIQDFKSDPRCDVDVAALEQQVQERAREHAEVCEKLRKLQPLCATAKQAETTSRTWSIAASRELAAAKQAVAAKLKKLDTVDEQSECPTCGRMLEREDREVMEAALSSEVDALRKEVVVLEARVAEQNAAAIEAYEEYEAMALAYEKLTCRRRELDDHSLSVQLERAKAKAERLEQLNSDLQAALDAVKAAEQEGVGHSQAANSWKLAAQALGLRGARVAMFSGALAKLEAASNAVLNRLGLGLKIHLSNSSTLKSGKEVDTLSINVDGAGGGDYNACSSGERARIDVALLLGLASLGKADGFAAFDEVFDSLDTDGTSRVASFLGEMSSEAQVVVVSHHADLQAEMPRATLIRVLKGDVSSTLEGA